MAKQKENKKNSATDQPSNNPHDVIGRTSGSQNPDIEKSGSQSDISDVDRQEGNLHHGECGGGLKSEDDR